MGGTDVTPRERANRAQLVASDPGVSAFVAASAGSGKTKLLTDRLLRLMLAGAPPARIQCLTFTKAAAAEMALRLQRRLGRWVTLPDADLRSELLALSVEPAEEALRTARALFARVLDLPGGMRIGTIHAFCQSLLRRFPLEAALSPHFQLVDERDAGDALAEAQERMLADARAPEMQAALAQLAGLASLHQFGRLVEALQLDRARLQLALELGPALKAAQRRVLQVTAQSDRDIYEAGSCWTEEEAVRHAARTVAVRGSPGCARNAEAMLDWLGRTPAQRADSWEMWRDLFLNGSEGVRGGRTFVNPALAGAEPGLVPVFLAEAERVMAVEDRARAWRMSEISAALATLAGPVVAGYARHKEEAGLLDYEDLIGRTSELLVDPGAAWVLYKLDGGIDHLLLDEVQDTAPAQWRIAHALTAEFFAGAGVRQEPRSVFAVGDRKQSIYSFQGADTAEFDRSRALLKRRVEGAGQAWRDTPLDVSFRSAAPVLALVDAVFADPLTASGVVEPGGRLAHVVERAGQAGAVELWPLAPAPEVTPPQPWTVPEENQGLRTAPQILAERLAGWIRDETSGGVMLPSRGRPLRPGDVMVLVRRRNDFARALVRALKAKGVAVAGLDRLVLTEQPAVQDLMALADALLLPQDDLSFACFLTSPLGGLSEDDLARLAMDRPGALWEALRDHAAEEPAWQAAWEFFSALLARVDYVPPYALFAECLAALGGRAKLYARLGPEAAEPVDELLNAALAYGRAHPPTLQGFLHWLRRSGAEVKREAEAAGDQVRVMTVHGAKGLQAPLVILPDTTALPPEEGAVLWADDAETGRAVPLWWPRKEFRCAPAARLRDEASQRRAEEHNRLLYVALTRAEDRLVVCGWQPRKAVPEACWYSQIARGFAGLPVEPAPFEGWEGDVLRHTVTQTAPPERTTVAEAGRAGAPAPAWLGRAPDWRAAPPLAEPARPAPLAPSRPEGVELGPVPEAASPLALRQRDGSRFQRGRLVHTLLQHLPELPAGQRKEAARRWLASPGHGLGPGEVAEVAEEVMAILSDPALAPLFGPGSRAEVPLTGVVGNAVVGGMVDRLAVLPEAVLVADFKTNRHAPERVEDTPVMYLRQMAAYRAVLRGVFPGRAVRCALVWTRAPRVAMLPDGLLDSHEPSRAPDAA